MKLKRDLADDGDGLLVTMWLYKWALGSLDPEYGLGAVQNFREHGYVHFQENDQALRSIMDDANDIAIWDHRANACQEMFGVIDRSLALATSKAIPNFYDVFEAMAYIRAVQHHADLILMMNQ